MTNTPNYNLGKPDSSDQFKDFRQLFNDNMDIIDNGLGNKNIANEYDDTSTYNVDEYVIYEGVLYKCTTAVTVAEPPFATIAFSLPTNVPSPETVSSPPSATTNAPLGAVTV